MPTLLAVNRNIAVFGYLKWRGLSSMFSRCIIRGLLLKVERRPDRKLTSEQRLHYEGNARGCHILAFKVS